MADAINHNSQGSNGRPRKLTCPSMNASFIRSQRPGVEVESNIDVTPFHKRLSDLGIKDGKVKKFKWRKLCTQDPCKSYEGPDTPGTMEEPNIDTSLHKQPSSPDSKRGKFRRLEQKDMVSYRHSKTYVTPNYPSIKDGKVKKVNWLKLCMQDPCKSYEGPDTPGTMEEPNIDTPLHKQPSSPDSKRGKFRRLEWYGPCKTYVTPNYPGSMSEPKIVTSIYKHPSSPGDEAEEPKPKVVTPFHDSLSNPDGNGDKVKKLKLTHMLRDDPCKGFEGPSSPGTKADEPNIDTSPLLKLPSSDQIEKELPSSAVANLNRQVHGLFFGR